MAIKYSKPILSRRNLFGLVSTLLVPSIMPANALETQSPATIHAHGFDAAEYVARLDAHGMPSAMIMKNGKLLMYKYWLPENVGGDDDGSKFEAFLGELYRRGRVFETGPNETCREAEDRVDRFFGLLTLSERFPSLKTPIFSMDNLQEA
jgi:hypothetical protein